MCPDPDFLRPEQAYQISGQILIGPEVPHIRAATLHIYLEDITVQDSDAFPVAGSIIPGISHEPGHDDHHPFVLNFMAALDERADYALRAHLDLTGDTEIKTGDCITTQNYPVLTFGHPTTDLLLRLHQI
ncbi:hypothetical protein [Coralliovum pocilloporae]|uniref:hypothetical protein n=1 Tax=Coralliovum pocilloporae TaxID=3066369 RepID=UPI0033078F4D